MVILGLSFHYHNAAAAILVDGKPVAMSSEERFTRKKNDSSYPAEAVAFVMREANVTAEDIDYVVFYEKPFLKFERIIKTSLSTFPTAPFVFSESIRHLFTDKLWVKNAVLAHLDIDPKRVLFSKHHLSHAASAFFASPFEEAAILTIDGVGEWATTTLGTGKGNTITVDSEVHFPHSLGLLYSAFTAFLGFRVNNGEYKVMGMAPYGKPIYTDKIKQVVKVFDDGSYALDLSYFAFFRSMTTTYSKKFVALFGPPREKESKFFTPTTDWPSYFGEKPDPETFARLAKEQQHYADMAASIQAVHEEIVIKMANALHRKTGLKRLCMAGGVALNSVANAKVLEQTPFEEIFIQPSAGDAGASLGAALAAYHIGLDQPRSFEMTHAYYGQSFSDTEIETFLKENNITYSRKDDDALYPYVADCLADGKVIGWFQGGFEWGPRALGHRSILADPRRNEMKDVVNTKIKFREPYRPFAPSVLEEDAEEYFVLPAATSHQPAKYMLFVVPVREDKKQVVPAITHVNGSARPQLVNKEASPRYWRLINAFKQKTNVSMVLNTSFNLRGEPIVTRPADAYSTFMRSGIDILVLGNYLIHKSDVAS